MIDTYGRCTPEPQLVSSAVESHLSKVMMLRQFAFLLKLLLILAIVAILAWAGMKLRPLLHR